MDALKDLQDEIKDRGIFGNTGYNASQARKILALLDKFLLEEEISSEDRPTPLDILIYAINSILYPTFLLDQLSDFIRLLTMVEFHRQIATYKAILLPNEAERRFQRYTDNDDEWRRLFMKIVSTCCAIDLKRLWLNGSDTAFWLRLNEYFSVLDTPVKGEDINKPVNHTNPFHWHLSAEDMNDLFDSINECSLFIQETLREAEDQRTRQSIDETLKSRDFQEQIRMPCLDSDTMKDIKTYLDFVSALVPGVYDVFNI